MIRYKLYQSKKYIYLWHKASTPMTHLSHRSWLLAFFLVSSTGVSEAQKLEREGLYKISRSSVPKVLFGSPC
jgi:hypothetical protein